MLLLKFEICLHRKCSGASATDRDLVDSMDSIIESSVETGRMAEWVVDGMEAEQFYIFSHPEFLPSLEQNQHLLLEDYQAAQRHFS